MENINISTVRNDNDLKSVFYHDKCDKYDYLIAVGCGVIAGLFDVFFVGTPKDSTVLKWTDEQVDKIVMSFSRKCGWTPREGKEDSVGSAIGFLEKKFTVNYDQRHSEDVNGLFPMSTKNHHMKSLAHSPDIIGLFFSILDQFTSTSSFLHGGQLITVQTESCELQGHDFISKLFCGMVNWFGHIMSDVAGSSGASGRGSGVVIPFYELFQLCDFGSFSVGSDRNTLSVVATKVFQEGYDLRFGATMGIPVVMCDLSIKLTWAIKHYFYHKKTLEECIPTKKHDDLRIMLIIGDGTLCLIDGVDAAVRSGGNWVNFFLRLNIIAWYRLILLVFREVCIRLGVSFSIQKQLDAYVQINETLTQYLTELEKIDLDKFIKETEEYKEMISLIEKVKSEEELNKVLLNEYKKFGFSLPYQGDFNDFMQDTSLVLEFK